MFNWFSSYSPLKSLEEDSDDAGICYAIRGYYIQTSGSTESSESDSVQDKEVEGYLPGSL